MAQNTTAADEAQTENDPELAAATEGEAVQSLQVHLGRDAMREFGREHGSRASGTKQEMAESMLEEAREQALGLLAEEGVELGGDLVEQEDDSGLVAPDEVPAEVMSEVAQEHGMGAGAVKGALTFQPPAADEDCTSEADEAALEARRRATPGYEAEDEDEDSGRQKTLLGTMLEQHPADYHRDNALAFSEQQVDLLGYAVQHAGATEDEAAEAVDCSTRYVNSVCHRWPASEDGIEALEDAGHEVPERFREVAEAEDSSE